MHMLHAERTRDLIATARQPDLLRAVRSWPETDPTLTVLDTDDGMGVDTLSLKRGAVVMDVTLTAEPDPNATRIHCRARARGPWNRWRCGRMIDDLLVHVAGRFDHRLTFIPIPVK